MAFLRFALAAALLLQQGLCEDTATRCSEHVCEDEASLLQVKMDQKINSGQRSSVEQELLEKHSSSSRSKGFAFVHVPYNFGNTVEKMGMFHANTSRDFMWNYTNLLGGGNFATPKKPASWDSIERMKRDGIARLDGEVWGHLNPDLQGISNVSGCPFYLTPPKYWPADLLKKYMADRPRVGILRDPYEKLTAQFRGNLKGYGDTDAESFAKCNINEGVKQHLKKFLAEKNKFASACTMLPQSEFWEGPYGITYTVSNWLFPESMNKAFKEFGYDYHINPADILHVDDCDNSWAGDYDAETRALIKEVYKSDFELICKELGHCDFDQTTCLQEIHQMCPDKAFIWDETKWLYCPRDEAIVNSTLNLRINPKCDEAIFDGVIAASSYLD